MNVIFVAWIIAVVVGTSVFLGILLKPPRDADAAAALRASGLAVLPSMLPLLEFVVRSVFRVPTSAYVTKWPFIVATGLGVVAIVASFMECPLRGMPPKWAVARLSHVVGWTAGAVIATSMILDV